MAVVATVQFGDLPTGSASFSGKWFKERPRRISLGNASDEGGWHAGLPIGRKVQRLLKTTQAEITQPRAHEIAGIAWLQSPEIKVALAARQPPTVSLLSRNLAEIGTHLRRKQVQYALPIFRNEAIQENQFLYSSGACLHHAADDHARVAVTYEDHLVGER